MPRETIKEVIMRRDGISEEEANKQIAEAKAEFQERLENDDMSAEDICEEYFGLEPDYLDEFF